MQKKKVSIMVPCYNESESLPFLYEELNKLMNSLNQYDWEVLFVNDGSKDETIEVIKKLFNEDNRIAYVDLSRNFGKEKAMLAGFDYVTGDCLIIMDADLQHPPTVIPDMLQKWEEGFQDVYGKRITRGKESWLRKKLSLLFYRILQSSVSYDILENVGDFRLLDRKCIESLKQLREEERYTKGMYCWIGFRKTYVEYETQERAAGTSSWNFFGLFKLAIDGIVSFTMMPLRFASIMGIVIAIVALLYMIVVFAKALIFGDPVAGYPTLITTILFLGSVQLIALGILGEYVGRIFNETKKRPTYIIQEYRNHLD